MKHNSRIGCDEFRRKLRLDRRAFLKAGTLGLGSGALGLSSLLKHEAHAADARRDNSVIILWMRGGPAHQDMWDPKPEAPVEYGGEFGVSSTNVPGIQLSDMLPMCGRIMEKWSIVRSLHHTDAGHSTADQLCFTGYGPGRNVLMLELPGVSEFNAFTREIRKMKNVRIESTHVFERKYAVMVEVAPLAHETIR